MIKKLLEKYTIEEIADAVMIPQKLTKKQQAEADLQLAEARKKNQLAFSESDRLLANLLRFKLQLEDYLKNEDFNTEKTFGHFLKEYLQLISKKRNEFAAEIDIHETLLSQLINNRRDPSENIMIRLELHTNNSIPATSWYRLVEKQKEHTIQNNKALRKSEKKFVKKKLNISF
jgi:plasmid maintenance system antidote protein VapI